VFSFLENQEISLWDSAKRVRIIHINDQDHGLE
jgi:hypothetical protein